jgi:hypothetical protein
MTLFRATFVRDGLPRGITFTAATNEAADDFVRWCEEIMRVEFLTVKPLREVPLQLDLQ